jgi:hypothetical protein
MNTNTHQMPQMGTRAELEARIATHLRHGGAAVDGKPLFRLSHPELWRACARRGLPCPLALGLPDGAR